MSTSAPKRFCQLVKLKPECYDEYVKVHNNVSQSVLDNLRKYHIEDYSIFYYKPFDLLIATFKYTGDNWEKDGELSRNDPGNFEWWKMTDKMQETLVEGASWSGDEKGWWAACPEVFRFEK